jgi:hypothetical protein
MSTTTPPEPDPLSEELDQMEERVVGRRVDPPPSDESTEPEDGPESEPS